MRCPYCGALDSKVVDSRPAEEGSSIRRRRECIACARRFTTYEKVELMPLLVIKKDGRREPYNPEKVRLGLMKACEKRPISSADIDAIIGRIEAEIANTLEQEVPSVRIGDLVMKELRALDQVAYVRFAAVYRSFSDVDSFMREIKTLLTDREDSKQVE